MDHPLDIGQGRIEAELDQEEEQDGAVSRYADELLDQFTAKHGTSAGPQANYECFSAKTADESIPLSVLQAV